MRRKLDERGEPLHVSIYMAQDRTDISVAARVLSQCMAGLREGVLPAIKRVIRYFRRYPRCIIEIDSRPASDRAGCLDRQ